MGTLEAKVMSVMNVMSVTIHYRKRCNGVKKERNKERNLKHSLYEEDSRPVWKTLHYAFERELREHWTGRPPLYE